MDKNNRILKIHYLWNGEKKRPKIQLSGDWLEKAGFSIGEKIAIVHRDNGIFIRRVSEEPVEYTAPVKKRVLRRLPERPRK